MIVVHDLEVFMQCIPITDKIAGICDLIDVKQTYWKKKNMKKNPKYSVISTGAILWW